jgi:DNA-binding MarR family transcriptional regulator
MKSDKQDVEQMVAALLTVIHSTERARRKGDASRLATLSVIGMHPESSLKAISEEVGFHPSSTTRQIQALEDDGHVKVMADPKDGRSFKVKLTATGFAELKRLQEIGLRRFISFVAKWEADEVRTLTRLLLKLEQSKMGVRAVRRPPGRRLQEEK